MKLTNLALLCAIFGPNATSATDAITGINDPLKRKLSSSSSSTSIASTKSAKISKAAGIGYQVAAEMIVAGSGCGEGHSCGDDCYTLNADAFEALEAIAAGDDAPEHSLVPVSYGYGICDSSLECKAKIPSEDTEQADLEEALEFYSEVQDECDEADPPPAIGLAGLGFAIGAAAKLAIGSTLMIATVGDLLQSYAIAAESSEFALVNTGLSIGYASWAGYFFQFAFAATAATIVAGTVAERAKLEAYIAYSFMLTGFVYPVVVYSIWSSSGFLTEMTNALSSVIVMTNESNEWGYS